MKKKLEVLLLVSGMMLGIFGCGSGRGDNPTATADTTPPTVPVNILVSALSSTMVSISWSASIDDVAVDGYQIYQGEVYQASIESSETSTIISGLTASTRYCFAVCSYDVAGNKSANSPEMCVTTLADATAPAIVTGLTATAASQIELDLSWSASTDDVGVAGYKIYREGVYLKSVAATAASDTGLLAGSMHCYTVAAFDAAGNESAMSAQACATTLPDITAPNIIDVTPTPNSVQVSVNTAVLAVFSESMDPLTINGSTFTVKDTNTGIAVAGTVSYDVMTKTATFTPSSSFAHATSYMPTVTKGVKDTTGNALSADQVWSFVTL